MSSADWSSVLARADVEVFDCVIAQVQRPTTLRDFDVLCVMRERTPLPADLLAKLSRLRLVVSTGPNNPSIDYDAAAARGVQVINTRGSLNAPIELTWALIQASARHLVTEATALRAGGWQTTVGDELAGRTLGVLGFGRIGSSIAKIGNLFGMDVVTWSDRVTVDAARSAGVRVVNKDQLFAESDVLSVHLVLVDATRGLVGARELERMKRSAWLVNTSRGEIVDEDALVHALRTGGIGGAALDVFSTEPLPTEHPFRTLPNVVATPHLGYVSRQQYEAFYADTVSALEAWLSRTSDRSHP